MDQSFRWSFCRRVTYWMDGPGDQPGYKYTSGLTAGGDKVGFPLCFKQGLLPGGGSVYDLHNGDPRKGRITIWTCIWKAHISVV